MKTQNATIPVEIDNITVNQGMINGTREILIQIRDAAINTGNLDYAFPLSVLIALLHGLKIETRPHVKIVEEIREKIHEARDNPYMHTVASDFLDQLDWICNRVRVEN